MEIIEGKLYFIKNEFIEKYNPKYHLMENKEAGTKRPTYFCFRNNFVFVRNLAGIKAVFLIQNMFPTLEKYIEQEYKKAGISIKVPKAVKEEIDKKTRDIFSLTNKGIIATFTNLPEFIKDIKNEVY